MFTPLFLIIAFMTSTFLLGLALGLLFLKFNATKKDEGTESEIQFWKQRWDQLRLEQDRSDKKIEALEKERDDLKGRLKVKTT